MPAVVPVVEDVPIDAATGGTTALTTEGGTLDVAIPAGAIGVEGAELSVNDFSAVAAQLASGESGQILTSSGIIVMVGRSSAAVEADGDPGATQITQTVGSVVEIVIRDPNTGQVVKQLSAPIALTFGFDVNALPAGTTVDDLAVFFWDEDNGGWVELPSTVDPVTGQVTGVVSHLTVFAVMVKIPAQRDISPDLRFYGVTGNFLAYAFKERFDSTGGLDRYGYPRTNDQVERGVTAQWFQRGRLEWHPGNPEGYRVLLGLVGSELLELRGVTFPEAAAPTGAPVEGFKYFPETGHYIAFAFLRYYDENGGLDAFGYPVSEEFVANGLVVQYFQRARFEFHPENLGTPYEVQLGLVGDEILRMTGRLQD